MFRSRSELPTTNSDEAVIAAAATGGAVAPVHKLSLHDVASMIEIKNRVLADPQCAGLLGWQDNVLLLR